MYDLFESFVNSERCKTFFRLLPKDFRLRALLIQKDVKLPEKEDLYMHRLRALLIQKDVKQQKALKSNWMSLRALLIQKDVKQNWRIRQQASCLRALLIQKDVKLSTIESESSTV